MNEETEYMLNHNAHEWDRLERQHQVWRHTLLDGLPDLGVGAGSRVLEVGCGSGVLLRDLADLVGPEGRAVGFERDPAAVHHARDTLAGLAQAEVVEGDLFALTRDAFDGPFDLIVARWVLAWLPKPEQVLRRLMTVLKPTGRLVVQDYNYDAIRLCPPQPAIETLFEVIPKAYALHGGDAWCAVHLPKAYHAAGLETVAVEPHCLAGGPESPVFLWMERFFRDYVQRLVEDGLLSPAERDASRNAWDIARATPGTVAFSPLVVNVIGRLKPQT